MYQNDLWVFCKLLMNDGRSLEERERAESGCGLYMKCVGVSLVNYYSLFESKHLGQY